MNLPGLQPMSSWQLLEVGPLFQRDSRISPVTACLHTAGFALESKSRVRTMERELCERDRQRRADLETQKNDVSGGGRFRLALLIASG